jgi:hypothetical protein
MLNAGWQDRTAPTQQLCSDVVSLSPCLLSSVFCLLSPVPKVTRGQPTRATIAVATFSSGLQVAALCMRSMQRAQSMRESNVTVTSAIRSSEWPAPRDIADMRQGEECRTVRRALGAVCG